MHTRARRILAALTVTALAVLIPTAAHATTTPDKIITEWHTWQAPTYAPNATDADSIGWPQTYVGKGQKKPTACGTTYQQDQYKGTRAQIDALIADGILTRADNGRAEDADLVQAWAFASSKPCPVDITPVFPEPIPPTCDTDGSFDFTGEPAENPNGVERDGYHLYVSPAPGSGPGDYTFTAYKIGSAGNAAYPNGTRLVGETTHTITVLPATGTTQSTDPEAPCYLAPEPTTPPTEEPTATPTPTPTEPTPTEPTPTDNPTSPHGSPTPEPTDTPTAVIVPPDDNPTRPVDRVSTPVKPVTPLAETGSDTTLGLLIVGLTIAAGAALVAARKAARR